MNNSHSRYAGDLGKWLDTFEWTHWATFTSRELKERSKSTGNISPSPETGLSYSVSTSGRVVAYKSSGPSTGMYRRGLSQWAKRIQPEMIFWGTEAGSVSNRIHCHSLIKLNSTSPETLDTMWRLGFKMFGRTHVEPFDPEKGAVGYVAKYVTKRLADYDLWVPGDGF